MILGIAALTTACSDPMKDVTREYQTALGAHIQLNITDDTELCRLSRKALRVALQKDDKGAYGEWLLRVDEYCK